MFKKLLALGAAGIAAAIAMLPASACGGFGLGLGGLGYGLGCSCGCGCGCGYLAGWWGPILGVPTGLFGGCLSCCGFQW